MIHPAHLVAAVVLAYAVGSAIVLAGLIPLAMIGERYSLAQFARWTGWIAVAVMLAAIAETAL